MTLCVANLLPRDEPHRTKPGARVEARHQPYAPCAAAAGACVTAMKSCSGRRAVEQLGALCDR